MGYGQLDAAEVTTPHERGATMTATIQPEPNHPSDAGRHRRAGAAPLLRVVPPLPYLRTSTDQALDEALDLLAGAGARIDQYLRLHGTDESTSLRDRSENEQAARWMRTSLDDITATLIGIAAKPPR